MKNLKFFEKFEICGWGGRGGWFGWGGWVGWGGWGGWGRWGGLVKKVEKVLEY